NTYSWRFVRFVGEKALPVALSHDEVEAAEDRREVRDHAADAHLGQDAEIAEGGPADSQAVWHASAAGLYEATKRALGRLALEVDLARRHVRSFGDDHEVLDQLLHRGERPVLVREDDALLILRAVRPARHRGADLADDAHALA